MLEYSTVIWSGQGVVMFSLPATENWVSGLELNR